MRIVEITEPWPDDISRTKGIFVKKHVESMSLYADIYVIVLTRLLPPRAAFRNLHLLLKWLKLVIIRLLIGNEKDIEKGLFNVIYFPYLLLPRPWFEFLNISLFTIFYSRGIKRLLIRIKPDVIICHWVLPAGNAVTKIAREIGVPVLIDVHEDPHNIKTYFPLAYKGWSSALNRADTVVVHSRSNWTNVLNASPIIAAKLKQIDLGIDSCFFNVLPIHDCEGVPDIFNIITIANLTDPGKNIDLLLRAFHKISKRLQSQVRLTIIGDGKLRRNLELLSQQLSISKYVRFLGEMRPVDLASQLQRANLFILPSRRESFGLAIVEACASGVPVIGVSSAGAIREVIDLGVKVIAMDEPSVKEIEEAIFYAYNNYCVLKREALQSVALIRDRYNWDKHASQYISLLIEQFERHEFRKS